MKSPFLRRFGMPSPFFDNETGFSPAVLFTNSEPGIWLDPSDLTTLFQDTAGTIPVSAPGDPVGLALDKSMGLTPGPEVVTNGTFDTNLTGWTNWGTPTSVTVVSGAAQITGDAFSGIYQNLTVTSGRTYRLSFNVPSKTGQIGYAVYAQANLGGAAILSVSDLSAGPTSRLFVATSSVFSVVFWSRATGVTFTLDDVSAKELSGNHAAQATSANRPTYGIVPRTGWRNLLTYTEQLDNAAWAKSGTTVTANSAAAPNGQMTADEVVYLSGASNSVNYTFSASLLGPITISFWARRGPSSAGTLRVGLRNDGAVVANAFSYAPTETWQRFSFQYTPSGTGVDRLFFYNDGSGTITNIPFYLWGTQVEVGSSVTNYQRVGNQFNVTEAGVPTLSYLFFGGSGDARSMQTQTITPGTGRVQIFAGVRKLTDAIQAVVMETGSAGITSNGINLRAPGSDLADTYVTTGGGTTLMSVTATGFAAPTTNVLSVLEDIAGDNLTLRVNGTQVGQNTGDQGTGNIAPYPLNVGARGASGSPLNGFLFSLIVRHGPNLDATTITNTETWVNDETGAY